MKRTAGLEYCTYAAVPVYILGDAAIIWSIGRQQRHCPVRLGLLSQIDIEGSNIIGDKAYGAKAIRDYVDSHNAAYTIPSRSYISDPWPVNWHVYEAALG